MAIKNPEEFIPTVQMVSEHHRPPMAYGTMLVSLEQCCGCSKWMVAPLYNFAKFPCFYLSSFEAQVKAAGWEINSYVTRAVGDNEYHICLTCQKADIGTFKCAMCDQERKSSEKHETFGMGEGTVEYACETCYSTLPAKEWDTRSEELEKAHRYDGC